MPVPGSTVTSTSRGKACPSPSFDARNLKNGEFLPSQVSQPTLWRLSSQLENLTSFYPDPGWPGCPLVCMLQCFPIITFHRIHSQLKFIAFHNRNAEAKLGAESSEAQNWLQYIIVVAQDGERKMKKNCNSTRTPLSQVRFTPMKSFSCLKVLKDEFRNCYTLDKASQDYPTTANKMCKNSRKLFFLFSNAIMIVVKAIRMP